MTKNLLFILVIIFGLILFFTDHGKKIENYLASFQNSDKKIDEKFSSAREKIIDRDLEDFFPLSEGKIWQYTTTHATKGKGKLTITNLSQQVIKGERAFPRKYEFDNGGIFISYIIYIAKGHGDIYQFAKGSFTNVEPHMYEPIGLIKEPLQVNSNWKRKNTTGIIEEIDEEITVPAGTFKGCVKVKTTFVSGAQTIQWFAPGIGVVKLFYKYPDARRNSEFFLEFYN